MDEAEAQQRAEQCFRRAYEAQMRGDLDEAIAWYEKSIAARPSAEAHTFLGWTLSFRGEYAAAIRQCQTAIGVDPDFGNPYNDIGSYLIALGRHEEAIPWFRKAISAPRYEPRHYPHVNLARVYVKQWKLSDALGELRQALALEPHYAPARREFHRILGLLN